MICDECGSTRVHWRCDNFETQTTKYKCLNCGHIMVQKKELKPLFNAKELTHLKKEKKKELRNKHKKGAKKRWKYKNPKNYSRTLSGKFMISKWINNKQEYFGSYSTEKEAMFVIEKLKECGWDKKELKNIKKELYHQRV